MYRLSRWSFFSTGKWIIYLFPLYNVWFEHCVIHYRYIGVIQFLTLLPPKTHRKRNPLQVIHFHCRTKHLIKLIVIVSIALFYLISFHFYSYPWTKHGLNHFDVVCGKLGLIYPILFISNSKPKTKKDGAIYHSVSKIH